MKFTSSWLKEHLNTNSSLGEISDNLTNIGLEVEKIYDPSIELNDFIVAKIISVKKHPNADKLTLCKVDIGKEIIQVVCGAPNAKKNLISIYAPIGSVIPETKLKIKKAKIRGIESFGMLCSGKELGLNSQEEGIMEISENLSPGSKIVKALDLNDPVIEIAITPNRPDCLGVYGIARDLAAKGVGKLIKKEVKEIKSTDAQIPVFLDFKKENTFCSIFSGRLIEGIENTKSPEWLKKKIEKIGLRSINAIVDVTNLITIDRCRPLHAYDADKIKGSIGARQGEKGEKIKTLDGKEYILDETICVISDTEKALGIGGIIGGDEFGSEENTKNIFLESAYFDPINIAESGRKLNINSDARYRFERGVDPNFVIEGLQLATKMIVEICGGKPGKISVEDNKNFKRKSIKFNKDMVRKLSGVEINEKEIKRILSSLGFSIDKSWVVSVPTWRPDIDQDVDLVEEIIRIYGLDKISSSPLLNTNQPSKPILTKGQKETRMIRRILASRGLIETISYSFINSEYLSFFEGYKDKLTLINPISEDLSEMRTTPLISLIDCIKQNNNRGNSNIGLFEIGPGFHGAIPEEQSLIASGVRSGIYKTNGVEKHWQGSSSVDAFDSKSDLMAVLDQINISIDSVRIDTNTPNWYHPGRSGNIISKENEIIGSFGEIHPIIISKFELPIISAFEIFLENISTESKKGQKLKSEFKPANLPNVKRDFSFDLPQSVSAETLISAVRSCGEDMINEIKLFDQFLENEEKKSLAFEVTIRPKINTLSEDEIEKISANIISAVENATGGKLRG
ncbi:MAG: phenylalanine--tRNA ligase subunit beta [Pseudomonadota bacterium]|nr:phenylalanine--tRNA ligase subunit beta [Pseudomonadota bacterium]